MATVKVNSRSPYFITATGAEGVGEQSLSMEKLMQTVQKQSV